MHPRLTIHVSRFLFLVILLQSNISFSQSNLLLNGSFEDINVCTEYDAECGVEGWFYLKEVKAQMLAKYDSSLSLGNNSFGLFYKWLGYGGFVPVIGAILPCGLQKDKRYTFSGLLSAKLNGRLAFKPGVVLGEKFYVANRPFSKNIHPDSITQIRALPGKNFYRFQYSFIATGTEKYLTFGAFIDEDTTSGKRTFIGVQSVSLVLDNFKLLPEDINETVCNDFMANKEIIYNYNFRHKEMDYSLYGRGELNIVLEAADSNYITRKISPRQPVKRDTLKIGDVLFDFSKANLKTPAIAMLERFFKSISTGDIDSIYIEGHTDSIGKDTSNIELSLHRCQIMQSWLVQNKILDKSAIQIHPFGESKPIASNSTPEGRALNRRVVLIIFRRSPTVSTKSNNK